MTSTQPIRLATRTRILKCRLQLLITVIGNVKFLSVLRMRGPFSLDTSDLKNFAGKKKKSQNKADTREVQL